MDKKKIKKINDVSPSFCLAKWYQVTIDLVHGTNHSCHHPNRHIIPLDEAMKNPAALHNTLYKKNIRKEMLEGRRPAECNYCWQIEDTAGEEKSDRIIKSLDHWAYPNLENVKESNWDDDFNPTYVEVMFDKACNFACGYCISDISSRIESEIKKFGPYKQLTEHRLSRHEKVSSGEDNNPYIEIFWKWFPKIANSLHTFRITGGEPLLSKNTFKLLDYLRDNPCPNLTLALNSNLNVKDLVLKEFIEKVKFLIEKNAIKKIEFYVSVDTYGLQAEYIRKGMNYKTFIDNIHVIKEELNNPDVIISCTYGIYSITGFIELLKEVLLLKKKYQSLILDISYLNHPAYLRANMILPEFYSLIKDQLEFMGKNKSEFRGDGFSEYETEKFRRVYQWIISIKSAQEHNQNRADFYTFIKQFDERYEDSFLEKFEELKGFMDYCKKSYLFIKKLT